MTTISPNSWRAWYLAARPKTLSGALAPVVAAIALALTHAPLLHTQALGLGVGCMLFAALMQVASNLINDYMDFRDGIDTADRLGPERACQQGWITPRAMRWGIAVCLVLALAVGLLLLVLLLEHSRYTPARLFLLLGSIGGLCVGAAFAYSRWFSRWALGDVLVLLFFGVVPTLGTYFVLTDSAPLSVLALGLAVGFAVDALLVVNNFRDRHTDRAVNKRTLINLLPTEWLSWSIYPLVGLLATLFLLLTDYLLHGALRWLSLFSFIYLSWHLIAARTMWRIGTGRALNRVLGLTSLGLMLLTVLIPLSFVLSA